MACGILCHSDSHFVEVVEALILFGFIVDYTCMNGASTNRSFTKMVFPETPKPSDFKAVNMFDQEKCIIIVQDIKHCVKNIWNSMESSKQGTKDSGRFLMYNE